MAKENVAATAAAATTEVAAPESANVNETVNTVINKVKCAVQSVFLNQYDENPYKTLSLLVNTQLKVMKQNDAGLYEESTSSFISLPLAAALAQINDEVVNYFIAIKGTEIEALKTALSGAEIEAEQKLLIAGETSGDVTNDTGHDQWFTFIKKVKISKMATLVMANQLGISIADLKALLG